VAEIAGSLTGYVGSAFWFSTATNSIKNCHSNNTRLDLPISISIQLATSMITDVCSIAHSLSSNNIPTEWGYLNGNIEFVHI
jgi:hypothetical protein